MVWLVLNRLGLIMGKLILDPTQFTLDYYAATELTGIQCNHHREQDQPPCFLIIPMNTAENDL